MKPLGLAGSWLLALLVGAGCASTEVTERERYQGAKLARPDRIIVHDLTAIPAGLVGSRIASTGAGRIIPVRA